MNKKLTHTHFMQIMALLSVLKFYEIYIQKCLWLIFLKIITVEKYWNMLDIRADSPIDTNFSVTSGDTRDVFYVRRMVD